MSGETNASGDGAGQQDARIAELSKESAGYRTQRNDAVRRAHAYETMLKAHNVDVSGVTSDALKGIPISGGKADGEFSYTPPKIRVPEKVDPPKAGDSKPALTLDEVKTWDADRINANWNEVKALMSARG